MEIFCGYSAEKPQLLIKCIWKGKGPEKRRQNPKEGEAEGGRELALPDTESLL